MMPMVAVSVCLTCAQDDHQMSFRAMNGLGAQSLDTMIIPVQASGPAMA
jgi:hypothetical protein